MQIRIERAQSTQPVQIESRRGRFRAFIDRNALRIGLSIVLIALTSFISFMVIEFVNLRSFEPFVTDSSVSAVSRFGLISEAPPPTQVRDQENPVNGVMVTKDEIDEMKSRKLVVVSLNNHQDARPQAGLSDADLVLEVLAEGGITRYNAFYYQNQNVKTVGPIRSARSYMLEFFLGFDDPVFVHEGQASYAPQEKAVPEINTLRHFALWDVESMQTAASRYRDRERIRTSGYVHSLMTGFELINKEVEKLGWKRPSNIAPLKFKFDAPVEERGPEAKIEMKFTSLATNAYSSSFQYDPLTNTYLRSIGGKSDIDANNGRQIAPKNVIVEYHGYRDAQDGHSRIILDMIGEDVAYIFRDGKVIKGMWKKASRTERTRYYDAEGKEIELNRGQIWVVNAAKTSARRISILTYDGKAI